MEHLPVPDDSDPPTIIVPIFATSNDSTYDRLDWMTYPSRCGYSCFHEAQDDDPERSEIKCQYLDLAQLMDHPWERTLLLLQEWLYFGLLCTIYGEDFQRSDFIRVTSDGQQVLTTEALMHLVWRKVYDRRLTHFRSSFRRHRIATDRDQTLAEWALIDHAVAQLDDIEIGVRFPQTREAPFPALMLSLRILMLSLKRTQFGWDWPSLGSAPLFLYPSLIPIFEHFSLERGWCPHQADHLSNTYTHITLYFLSCLRRVRSVDHSGCIAKSVCEAYTPPEGAVGRHVEEGCACGQAIVSNPAELMTILKAGEIPVVEARYFHRQKIRLRYIKAFPGLDYTAISHPWADGLGDHGQNDLPYCQVSRILGYIRHLEESWPDRVPNFARPGSTRYFWLDVYCVPIDNPELYKMPLEDLRRIKQAAIARMVPTYAFARRTLILSKEIEHITSAAIEPNEFYARMVVSGWYGRYWCHQELKLSFSPRIRLSDGFAKWQRGTENLTVKRDSEYRYRYSDRTNEDRAPFVSTKYAGIGSELYEKFRFFDGEQSVWTSHRNLYNTDTFWETWNGFVGKTSSKREDMHAILANFLNLNATDVLKLEMGARMKAIINSVPSIPIGLLFDVPPESIRKAGAEPLDDDALWLARFPGEFGKIYSGTRAFGRLRVRSDGLLLRRQEHQTPYELLRVGEVRQATSGAPWQRLCISHKYEDDVKHVVELFLTSRSEQLLNDNAHNMCFLVNTNTLGGKGHWKQGACVLLIRETDDTLYTRYLCQISWTETRFAAIGTLEQAKLTTGTYTTEPEIRTELKNIVFTSAMSRWPKVRVRRNNQDFFPLGQGWVIIFFCLNFVASITTCVTFLIQGIGPLAPLAIFGEILVTYWLLLVRFERRYYLVMESFLEDYNLQRSWWQRVERVLPSPRTLFDTRMSLYRRTALISMFALVGIFRIASRVKEWTRSRTRQSARQSAHELSAVA